MNKKDHLIKDSMILFLSSSVVNISNFIFHSIASRQLGPENYGVLVTLLAMIIIVTMPAMSLQMTVVKKTSVFSAHGKYGNILHLFKRSTKWFFALGFAYMAGFLIAMPFLQEFFRVWDKGLIVILSLIALASMMIINVRGILQGMQKFVSLGINSVIDAGLRLLLLFVFAVFGWGTRGALATTMAGSLIAYIAGVAMISFIFKYKETKEEPLTKREFFSYAMPVFFAMTGFSLLSYMDVFMVKHFFDEHNAGLYSATSMIGKAFLFFPSAIVMTLFPKVSEQHALNQETKNLLNKSLLLTAAISVAGIVFCFLFPKFIIGVMFGEKFMNIEGVVRLFGIAILPLVLLNVVINYSLAVHKYDFIYIVFVGIIIYASVLWFFHDNFFQVIGTLFVVNLLILISSIMSLRVKKAADIHAV